MKKTPLNGGVNNLHITLREKIDRRKLEYILNRHDDFDLGSRMIIDQRQKNGQSGTNYTIKTIPSKNQRPR